MSTKSHFRKRSRTILIMRWVLWFAPKCCGPMVYSLVWSRRQGQTMLGFHFYAVHFHEFCIEKNQVCFFCFSVFLKAWESTFRWLNFKLEIGKGLSRLRSKEKVKILMQRQQMVLKERISIFTWRWRRVNIDSLPGQFGGNIFRCRCCRWLPGILLIW